MSTPPINSPDNRPPGEPNILLLWEKCYLDGAVVTGFVYGIHFTLFVMCFRLLSKQVRHDRSKWPFLLYITVMFILGTLYFASATRTNEMEFIENRNYPGGPVAWASAAFSIPINLLGVIVYVLANWLADGLMLWRCTVVWSGRFIWFIMSVPFLVYLTSIAMGILLMFDESRPGASIWQASSVNIVLAYYSTSLALNIFLTILILVRLLLHRRAVINALGRSHSAQYTSTAAMLVESAALYAICSILFLVPYVVNHPLQGIFMQVLSQVQIIAPLLIIYRVATGRAWSRKTTATPPPLVFASNPKGAIQATFSTNTTTDYPMKTFNPERSDVTGSTVVFKGEQIEP